MLKKMLVVVGAMLVLTSASYATTPSGRYQIPEEGTPVYQWDVEQWDNHANIKAEAWNWPAEYKFLTVCEIPVKMDLGFWFRVEGCKDAKIILKQIEIRKYSGSTKLKVRCNVSMDLAVDFVMNADIPAADYGASVTPTTVDPGPDATEITVEAHINNFKIDQTMNMKVGTCITVGKVLLKVRPAVNPKMAGAC